MDSSPPPSKKSIISNYDDEYEIMQVRGLILSVDEKSKILIWFRKFNAFKESLPSPNPWVWWIDNPPKKKNIEFVVFLNYARYSGHKQRPVVVVRNEYLKASKLLLHWDMLP